MLRALLALAVLVQLVVLYLPSPPSTGAPEGLDKLVHAAVFFAPALLGVLAGLRPLWLGLVLAAHAVVSELVQHGLLPARSGDVWDAVADVVGVGLGIGLGLLIRRRSRATLRSPSGRS